jgi:hypothetical protein
MLALNGSLLNREATISFTCIPSLYNYQVDPIRNRRLLGRILITARTSSNRINKRRPVMDLCKNSYEVVTPNVI